MPFIIDWVDKCSGDEKVVCIQTPVGQLIIHNQQDVITQIDWKPGVCLNQSGEHELNRFWRNPDQRIHVKLLKQGSLYRNRVWSALCEIPFGETMTYSALANKIGSSARAVGNACRDNPYTLIVPCHRVVSASGMGGYCGQTEGDFMAIKTKLLEFEASHKK
ncbi:MAG: methylated-DNA--[protein]-cysteine S-methyltransferase [Methylobacter sp.]